MDVKRTTTTCSHIMIIISHGRGESVAEEDVCITWLNDGMVKIYRYASFEYWTFIL